MRRQECRKVTLSPSAGGLPLLPIRASTVAFGLDQANQALQMLKHDELKGAAVLHPPIA